VNRRRSQSAQAGQVLSGAVAFVDSQSISGIGFIKLYHPVVSLHFGNNGGTGDRETQTITSGYTILGQFDFGK